MYNVDAMILPADVMRLLLLLCWTGMVLLAVFFLRNRRLTFYQYLRWGLLAVMLPFLGAFLVILLRPGRSSYRRSRRRRPAPLKFPFRGLNLFSRG